MSANFPYSEWSRSACRCSTRTPTEKGFTIMSIPFPDSISNVSLALCPTASIMASVFRSYLPLLSSTVIDSTLPLLIRISSSRVRKRISPPSSVTRFSIFPTTSSSLSVPTCGFASVRISSGAPNSWNFSSTYRQIGSFILVTSFPSEKVPAPPAPNCMFVEVSSTPVRIKLSTDA